MSNTIKRKRMVHYDLLRIVAAFSVVMLHVAAQFWYTLDIYSTEWIIANSYDAVVRFGVPIFVMISGAMFLDRDYTLDVKRLYKHNILRMVILYVGWSCLYGLYDCRRCDFRTEDIKIILREMLSGRYHLWFIPMIVGIYVLLPVLKSWVDHTQSQNVQYFLGLFLIIKVCGETLRALTVTDEIHYILDIAQVELVCGYVGYFIWGYYLAHIGVNDKLRKIIYALVIPSAIMNIVLGNYLAWKVDRPVGAIYDSFGVFTFILVTALFLVTVEKGSKLSFSEKSTGLIKELSADTLGVYLIHIGLIEILEQFGIHSMLVPIVIGIPLYSVVIFLLCTVIAFFLRRIPIIGRYLC